ncbi:hypothetical protein FQR65_LT15480 [Abscondita terminalis]|nr:hypothetical protein FQR65_LT15480 [Abscondita terminalis]
MDNLILIYEFIANDLDIINVGAIALELGEPLRIIDNDHRRNVVPRNENFFEQTIPNYEGNVFLEHFRMNRGTFEMLLQELANNYVIVIIGNKTDLINEKHPSTISQVNKNFTLPICDDDGLSRLEKTITSEDNKKDLIRILSLLGGNSIRQNINNILKKMLSKDMALKFSLKEKQKKKPFQDLNIYKAVTDGVRITFPNVTDVEIDKYIGYALASAGDRNGGRKERENKSVVCT